MSKGIDTMALLQEVDFLRGLFDYCMDNIDGFDDILNTYMRVKTGEELKALGATDEQIKDACDFADKMFNGRKGARA